MSEWVNPAPRTAVMWEVCFCSIYFWHGLVIQRKNLPDNGAQSCAGSLQNRAFSGSSFSVPANEGKCVDSDRKQHAGKWKVIGKSWLFVTFCYFKAFVSFLKCTFEKKKKWKEEKKKKTFLFFCFFLQALSCFMEQGERRGEHNRAYCPCCSSTTPCLPLFDI